MPSGGLVSNYSAGVYRSKDSIRNFKIKYFQIFIKSIKFLLIFFFFKELH